MHMHVHTHTCAGMHESILTIDGKLLRMAEELSTRGEACRSETHDVIRQQQQLLALRRSQRVAVCMCQALCALTTAIATRVESAVRTRGGGDLLSAWAGHPAHWSAT